VTAGIFDPNTTNDYDEMLLKILVLPELTIDKEAVPETAMAGDPLEYHVVARNLGPSKAWNVDIIDELPDGVKYVKTEVLDWPGSVCVYSPGLHELNCFLGNVEADESVRLIIHTKVDDGLEDGDILHNWARVRSRNDGANDELDTPVETKVNLRLEKYADPVKVQAGEQIKYTINVRNRGPSDAVDVVVTDELPEELEYEISTANCQLVSQDPDKVECNIGKMGGGSEEEFDIWARVGLRTANGTALQNEACVEGESKGGNSDDDCDTANNLVLAGTDLGVTMTATGQVQAAEGAVEERANQVTAGLGLKYVLTVENRSPSEAGNVVVEQVLPAGIEVTGVTTSLGRCVLGTPGSSSDPMVCYLGFMDPGTVVTVELDTRSAATLPDGHILYSKSSVDGSLPDAFNANDFDMNLTMVLGARAVSTIYLPLVSR
jgi:uncharacterized repeat protein (TIGR01451 family)